MSATGQAISQSWRRPVCCGYCGGEARLVEAMAIFPMNPQMSARGQKYWHCAPCHAWVKASVKTSEPLGTLADPLLRSLRDAANDMLNKLADLRHRRNGGSLVDAKAAGRAWLLTQVPMKIRETVGGKEYWLTQWADVDECRAAIKLMEKWVKRPL